MEELQEGSRPGEADGARGRGGAHDTGVREAARGDADACRVTIHAACASSDAIERRRTPEHWGQNRDIKMCLVYASEKKMQHAPVVPFNPLTLILAPTPSCLLSPELFQLRKHNRNKER